jgi:phosphonate transport system substrate-binding protein
VSSSTLPTTAVDRKHPVLFASFLGDNAFGFYQQVVAYLATSTGLEATLDRDPCPARQDHHVNQGKIHAVFTCGLPYVRKHDQTPSLLRLVAAPVMAAARYNDRPVYFSDIIVRSRSAFQTLPDLKGHLFAYNEVHSLSGYVAPSYFLLQQGLKRNFFGQLLRSGSHAVSMNWVATGRVAAAAIDSVVLEMELAQRPQLNAELRVIGSAGPMPMPPVAASSGLTETQLRQLRQALVEMHTRPEGQAVLRRGGVLRFANVTNRDYDPIRQIVATVEQAGGGLILNGEEEN